MKRCLDHVRLDIQSEYAPADSLRRWNSERAVAATELNYIAIIRGYEIERTVIYFLAEVGAQPVHLGHENHSEARWLSATEAWELLTETSPEQLPALEAAVTYLQTT